MVLTAANVVWLLAFGNYQIVIGPLRLVAHGFSKPLLILNGAFLLCALFRKPAAQPAREEPASLSAIWWIPLVALVWFISTLGINPLEDEWNYRGYSAAIQGVTGIWNLFTAPQLSAWYRPLGFLSLWIDSRLFQDHFWAYHIPNCLLHAINALLVSRLAERWGLTRQVSAWAGVLYATAAIGFEPIMWPSARFDLLAVTFLTLALISATDLVEGGGRAHLVVALGGYALAVLSKESGYAFPVLILIPILRSRNAARGPSIRLGATAAAATAILVAVRFAVLGGIGGYASAGSAGSPHLSVTANTLASMVWRPTAGPLLGVNGSFPTPDSASLAVGLFALLLAAAALAGVSTVPTERKFALAAIASAIPVAVLLGWISPSMQHSRYLYMPTLFIMMLVAAALSHARRPALLLFGFAALNLACGVFNTRVYATMYHRAGAAAGEIVRDWTATGSSQSIRILGMPAEPDGVFFLRKELVFRVKEKAPNAIIDAVTPEENPLDSGCGGRLCYEWLPERHTLARATTE